MGDLVGLGEAVVARRIVLGYLTRQDFSRVTGLSYRTLGYVERGTRAVSSGTWAIIEQHLHWARGSALSAAGPNVLEGAARSGSAQSASSIRGLSEAYAVAAQLVDRGDHDLGQRLVLALSVIGELLSHSGAPPH